MMRHIPKQFSQTDLINKVNDEGFTGCYNFIYLPMDARSRFNRGFAFINLNSEEAALAFYNIFHKGEGSRREESLSVMTAHVQGLQALTEHFAAAGSRRQQHCRPLFLCPWTGQPQQHEKQQEKRQSALEEQPSPMAGPVAVVAAVQPLWGLPFRELPHPHRVYKFCPFCGSPNGAQGNFCAHCGMSFHA